MKKSEKPLLSICIPTYNRAEMLSIALASLLPQIAEFGDAVEVIVSDNSSSDQTSDIVKNASQYCKVKYHRNSENIGACPNCMLLVDRLATGEYCWLLGDDDFLRPGAVKQVMLTLQKFPEIDYVYVNLCHINKEELLKYPQPISSKYFPEDLPTDNNILTDYYFDKWEKMIDPRIDSNFFGAICNSVFRRDRWCNYSKNIKITDAFAMEDFDSVFPHIKILAQGMMGRKAAYLGKPWIVVADGVRDWTQDYSPKVVLRFLNEAIDLFESLGVDAEQITRCRNYHMRHCAPYLVSLMFEKKTERQRRISLDDFFQRYGNNEALYLNLMNIFVQRYRQMEEQQQKLVRESQLKSEINDNTEKNIFIDASCDIRNKHRIYFGKNVVVQKDCWLNIAYENAHGEYMIELGDGTNIGRRCTISAANKIVFGKNVLIGPNVFIADTSHEYCNINIPIMHQGITTIKNTVKIGDGSWIGTNSVIIGNVSIGRGCVIGANSIINCDIPDYVVAVGNPAKIVKVFDYLTNEWITVDDSAKLETVLMQRDSQ